MSVPNLEERDRGRSDRHTAFLGKEDGAVGGDTAGIEEGGKAAQELNLLGRHLEQL